MRINQPCTLFLICVCNRANVLYDRPPDVFRPISISEKHDILLKLSAEYDQFAGAADSTKFTEVVDGVPQEKRDRPRLLVSSTSWTEDEDFGVLLEALRSYEQRAINSTNLPDIVCVITGKGPLKDHYSELIANEQFNHVSFVLPWLQPEDYPRLLAAADVGVCLHTSSSGLDLPMKVVDMFGCAVPVCAIAYEW